MPQSRQPQAYGDIFSVSTPYLDRASQQLYQEQKIREAEKQKANDALDNEFKAILPGIRSADTSKLADLWGGYKTSWMALQKNPPKKQADYLQAQKDLLMKKAAVYNHVNGSKEVGANEKLSASQVMKDKNGLYRDDAHDIIMKGLQTPYDQKINITDANGQPQQIDWTDPNNLKRHIDTKSVMDAINYATGKPQTYSGDKYKDKPTDIQYQQPEITVKNNPLDFHSAMVQAAVKNPKDFLNTLPHPTDAEYFEKEKLYNEIDPKIKKMWRMSGELPDDNNLSDLERAIKYQAMTYALNPNNQPQVKVRPVTDATLKDKVDFEQAQALAKLHEAFTRSNQIFSVNNRVSKTSDEQLGDIADTLVSAAKSGDVDVIKKAFSPLSTGGKFLNVKLYPAGSMNTLNGLPKPFTEPTVSVTTIKNGKEHTDLYNVNDPYLKDKMKGVINTTLKVGEKKEVQKNMGNGQQPATSHKKAYNPKTGKFE